MTLGEMSRILDAEPKWVLNTMTALRLPGRYSMNVARQLALGRAIHEASGAPIARAFAIAKRGLEAYRGGTAPVTLPLNADGDVALTLDVHRLMSSLSVRLAHVRSTFAPRARGRPPCGTRDALRDAVDWGLDISLIRDNLSKSPAQRLRQLDAMVTFSQGVRRTARPR